MKYLLLALILTFSTNAFAVRKGAPFQPHDDRRFDTIEDNIVAIQAVDTLLNGDSAEGAAIAKKYAKAVYDVAIDGGSSTAHSLGVQLPAGAIITGLYVYINTVFTDSGTGSVGLQCAGTNDLMAYQDLTVIPQDRVFSRIMQSTAFGSAALIADGAANAGAYFANQAGASVPTACTLTAVVRSDSGYVPQIAGKFTAIIEYFNRN